MITNNERTNKGLHEYTKWDTTINVSVQLEGISSAATDRVNEAYHHLAQVIAEESSDFDTVEMMIGSNFRQHLTNPGPF